MSVVRLSRPVQGNPPAFAHVGITVPSLDEAVAWYSGVLGLELMAGPTSVRAGDGHAGAMAADVFGPSFGAMRVAHVAASNGVAVEIFEFDPPAIAATAERFDYRTPGILHLCIVERDIEGIVDRIRRCGGRQRTGIWSVRPGEPYRMCYCQDPFGTIVEIYSHSHEQTCASARRSVDRVAAG